MKHTAILAALMVCMYCPPCHSEVCAHACYPIPCPTHGVGRIIRERTNNINATSDFGFTETQNKTNEREGRRTRDINQWLNDTLF